MTVRSSLYESLQSIHEDPGLAVLAADVLAWDVDFYQDVRNGDRMRVVVEKVFADDRFVRYGEILATEYDGGHDRPEAALPLHRPRGRRRATSTTTARARSAASSTRRCSYAHITSGFGSRRHPLKGYVQAPPRHRLRRADRHAGLGGGRRHGQERRLAGRLRQGGPAPPP